MRLINKSYILCKLIYSSLLLTLLMGCATVGSIKKSYEVIDYSDGINPKEAIIIAKQHIIGTEYTQQYRIINPRIKEKKEYWEVTFLPKNSILTFPWVFFNKFIDKSYRVYVKKSTGEIAWDGRWGTQVKK